MGVPLYWVLDPERREAEVWTPERHFPEVERERLTWHPDGADEPLTLDLRALFAPP
jgi:Uma2 family endonuclease